MQEGGEMKILIQSLLATSFFVGMNAFAGYVVTIQEPSLTRAYHKPMQDIDIHVAVSPKLAPTDSFVIYLNDEAVAYNSDKVSVPTANLAPNQYQIRAEVQDETGRAIASASQVTHVIQNTAVIRANKEAMAKKQAKQLYDAMPWYQKLYLNLRQDVVVPK